MKRFPVWLGALLVVLLVSGVALARKVYLNNVRIDGLTNQTFNNVQVRIDAEGNIYITGSQYQVRRAGDPAPTATPPTPRYNPPQLPPIRGDVPSPARPRTQDSNLLSYPSASYVMVVQRSVGDGSGYALKVYINGTKVRDIPLSSQQDVLELTPHLRKGSNQVMIEASKEKNSATGTVTLNISKGTIKDGRVEIQQPFQLEYTRNATETTNYRHIYTIVTP